jgi:hypothetical protein
MYIFVCVINAYIINENMLGSFKDTGSFSLNHC